MNKHFSADQLIRFGSWVFLACGLLVGGYLILGPDSGSNASARFAEKVNPVSVRQPDLARANHSDSMKAGSRLGHVPIEEIKVGMRVPARNPEVSDDERSTWEEPDWNTWVKLELKMPKPDGSLLKMELLRSEEWVLSQVGFVVGATDDESTQDDSQVLETEAESQITQVSYESPAPSVEPELAIVSIEEIKQFENELWFENESRIESDWWSENDSSNHVPLAPLRTVFRELALSTSFLQGTGEQVGIELLGLTVQMDLPELGLTGQAVIVDVEPCTQVKTGPGKVVTATFHHGSSEIIDLEIGDDSSTIEVETESLGTTVNHPFWSVDRQEYVQAGSLEIGERLQTFQGDTKRIVSKLARPGPEAVYNLEIQDEHTYFVGTLSTLVHNSGEKYGIPPPKVRIGLGKQPWLGDLPRGVRLAKERANSPGWTNARLTIADSNKLDEFATAFFDATRKADEIHFNLKNVDVSEAWRINPSTSPTKYLESRTVTEWELRNVLNNQELFSKTTFHNDGVTATLDDAWELLLEIHRR